MIRTIVQIFLLFVATSLPVSEALAHAKGENYVWINVENDFISGRFEIRREDLKSKLGIDVDAMGESRLEGARA